MIFNNKEVLIEMKKLDKAIIFLLSIAILTIVIITFIIPDLISSPIKITLSLIFYVFIIIVLVYSYKLNKKDNDNFLEISNLIKNNEFFKAEEYIKANLIKSKHLVSDIKYKFLLVTLELTKGNNDEAKFIIDNNIWRAYEKLLYYFKALLSLKDHNIDDAILYKDKLIKANKKLKGKKKDQFKDQIINIEKIILAVNKGIKIDIKSQFPIVDEIINNIKQKMN